MAKKSKTSFKKKKKEDTHKRNDREEYSAEFNQVIHNNPQQPSKKVVKSIYVECSKLPFGAFLVSAGLNKYIHFNKTIFFIFA